MSTTTSQDNQVVQVSIKSNLPATFTFSKDVKIKDTTSMKLLVDTLNNVLTPKQMGLMIDYLLFVAGRNGAFSHALRMVNEDNKEVVVLVSKDTSALAVMPGEVYRTQEYKKTDDESEEFNDPDFLLDDTNEED